MVGWLRARNSALIDVPTIRQWPAMLPGDQPASHGWRYLRETVTEYALDVGDGELLLDHFLDGLAERSPESRRRQIDLGFAARYPPGHAIHRSRAVLAVGSRIALRASRNLGRRLATVRCARGRRRRPVAALRTGNRHALHRSTRRRHTRAPTAGRGGAIQVPDQRASPILQAARRELRREALCRREGLIAQFPWQGERMPTVTGRQSRDRCERPPIGHSCRAA